MKPVQSEWVNGHRRTKKNSSAEIWRKSHHTVTGCNHEIPERRKEKKNKIKKSTKINGAMKCPNDVAAT